MESVASTARRPRIVLYSHDTMGLGHVRRNLLIARALVGQELGAEILLIAGTREAGSFAMPDGVDCLTLPAYHKEASGSYRARSLRMAPQAFRSLRSETIAAALRRFEPDLFIVDNVPRGVQGELTPILQDLRAGGRTLCVLGLRDVLDDAESVRRQWWRQRNYEAVRDFFHEVWVYGDPGLYDTGREYGFESAIADKLVYTGYLDQTMRFEVAETAPGSEAPGKPYVLCAVGGGQDGMKVTEAFARATLPSGHAGVIVTGPFMPPKNRQLVLDLVSDRDDMKVHQFVSEPIELMRDAERIVAMGGYNTVMEILSLGKRALVIPRVKPRREQIVRAERLAERGVIDVLHPDDAGPEQLSAWMHQPLGSVPDVRASLDFYGLKRIPLLAADLLRRSQPSCAFMPASAAGAAYRSAP